jgi:hypothetical protein
MRINAQAAPVAPTTRPSGRLHRRTRTVASIPQSALPPLPPPGLSTPVPLRPYAPTTTTYGATDAAASLSMRVCFLGDAESFAG